jgi:hypothetical protein
MTPIVLARPQGSGSAEAEEIKAIATSRIWDEASRIEPTHTWDPAADDDDEEKEERADDEPFDIAELGSVQDGGWQPITSRAHDLLAKDPQQRFGEVQEPPSMVTTLEFHSTARPNWRLNYAPAASRSPGTTTSSTCSTSRPASLSGLQELAP